MGEGQVQSPVFSDQTKIKHRVVAITQWSPHSGPRPVAITNLLGEPRPLSHENISSLTGRLGNSFARGTTGKPSDKARGIEMGFGELVEKEESRLRQRSECVLPTPEHTQMQVWSQLTVGSVTQEVSAPRT